MIAKNREELVINAASTVHEIWCNGELRAFYSRFKDEIEKGVSTTTALSNACNKNGKPRNVVEIDKNWVHNNEATMNDALKTFEGFKVLFDRGFIEVKRFTARNLTEAEQQRAGAGNYNANTKEENILRPFEELSADSQRENLEAAKGAAYVYEEYAKRGLDMEQFSSPKTERAVGTLIHADWMRRNEMTDSNKHLFVPYEELDEWAKQQDLDVFKALITEVENDEKKYAVAKEEGLSQLNPVNEEQAVLDAKFPERNKAKSKELGSARTY